MKNVKKQFDCAIIGAGPAGLVAALYLKRMRRSVLLFDGGPPRATKAPRIRNLIGYVSGISGKKLLVRLRNQLKKCPPTLRKGNAVLRLTSVGFVVHVGKKSFSAKKVILASGVSDVEPPLRNFRTLTDKGLLGYCPICDGYERTDKRVAVFVRDSNGLEKVDFLRDFTEKLSVILLDGYVISKRKMNMLRKKDICVFRELISAAPSGRLLRILAGGQIPILVDFAYAVLGTQVNDFAISKLTKVRRTRDGCIRVDRHQQTSVKGLYAIGDCVQGLSQVSVAVGQAAIAATAIHNELR